MFPNPQQCSVFTCRLPGSVLYLPPRPPAWDRMEHTLLWAVIAYYKYFISSYFTVSNLKQNFRFNSLLFLSFHTVHRVLPHKADVSPKRRDITWLTEGPNSRSYGLSSSHVWMWDLDYKEGWAPKNRCFRTVVLDKTLKSPLDCKKMKPVNRKGNQPWIVIGRIKTEAETPILWLPDAKNWLIRKNPDPLLSWSLSS